MSHNGTNLIERPDPATPTGDVLSTRSLGREAVQGRRTRMLAVVYARRFVLVTGVVAMTVGSAILAKEVRSAPALADIRVLVREPEVGPMVGPSAEAEHAPDAPDVTDEGDGVFPMDVVETTDTRSLVFLPEAPADLETTPLLEEDEAALATWGELVMDSSVRWFDGRPVRPAYTLTLKVTAYSPDERSCPGSADGITATLHSVETNGHCLVAADPKWFPAGTLLSIPGYDEARVVPVLDVGGAIKGRHIDVLYATHERARRWGVQKLKVTVWEYADGKPVVSPRKLR